MKIVEIPLKQIKLNDLPFSEGDTTKNNLH